jgi:hypothetical protein
MTIVASACGANHAQTALFCRGLKQDRCGQHASLLELATVWKIGHGTCSPEFLPLSVAETHGQGNHPFAGWDADPAWWNEKLEITTDQR